MSGRWYAKVLLPEPLPGQLRHSIEHFASGTGCMALHWPTDKENRTTANMQNAVEPVTRKDSKKGPNPPEAWLAYGSAEERQAALEENQARPGEWGFYAAATKGSRDNKDRKGSRGLLEGEELAYEHRGIIGDLQPPQMGRGGLLGDAPADWEWSNTSPVNMDVSSPVNMDPWADQSIWNQCAADSWQQWGTGTWGSMSDSRDEWGAYIDPPAHAMQSSDGHGMSSSVPMPLDTVEPLQPLRGFGMSAKQLSHAEDLVKIWDSYDVDDAEFRSLTTCLPSGLVGAFAEDELEDMAPPKPCPPIDFECWGVPQQTPPRTRRANTFSSPSPCNSPLTPGSAAAVAMWRPIKQTGLPTRATFIHFESSSGSRVRARSCPVDMDAEVQFSRPALVRAKTAVDPPPMPWAYDEAIVCASEAPMDLAESPIRKRVPVDIETPQRAQGAEGTGDDHTPAPRQGPLRARRGGRGRHGKGAQKAGLNNQSWRPSLWSEAH